MKLVIHFHRTGDVDLDRRRLRHLYVLATQYPGHDEFCFILNSPDSQKIIDFPGLKIRINNSLRSLERFVGRENIRIARKEGGKPCKKKSDYEKYISSNGWRKKRIRALARANHRCERCASDTTELHVHHKTYKNFRNEPLEDLIVLCKSCHNREHVKRRNEMVKISEKYPVSEYLRYAGDVPRRGLIIDTYEHTFTRDDGDDQERIIIVLADDKDTRYRMAVNRGSLRKLAAEIDDDSDNWIGAEVALSKRELPAPYNGTIDVVLLAAPDDAGRARAAKLTGETSLDRQYANPDW